MKRYCCFLMALIVCVTITFGCEPDDTNLVPKTLRINDFVWKGMNLYYLWQEEVPNLEDDRFDNQQQLNPFLNLYNDPLDLFADLRVDPSIDRFSVITNDYRVLEGILSGTTKNNGVDYGLRFVSGSSTDIFGWVRYILPNSDASTKDIERGDIFYAVNGVPLTINNYRELLSPETYTLNLADYDNGAITPNGQSVTLTKSVYSENPVYHTEVFSVGSHKIGYLMYNGFFPSYEQQLNQAFGELKSQNITELVLDLRYNSGGSIATATKLASMITGQFTGQLFAREQWNAKMQPYFESTNPQNIQNLFLATVGNSPINDLQLTKVYILTSNSTASASELVINGLEPYIDVIQIGDNTIGKNVGSVTLYDSPAFGKQDRNPNHFYAMQPIVLKVVNKDGFGDYQVNGLVPDYFLQEDLNGLGVLGDINESLLSTAIGQITSAGRFMRSTPSATTLPFKDSKSIDNLQNQMYTDFPKKPSHN